MKIEKSSYRPMRLKMLTKTTKKYQNYFPHDILISSLINHILLFVTRTKKSICISNFSKSGQTNCWIIGCTSSFCFLSADKLFCFLQANKKRNEKGTKLFQWRPFLFCKKQIMLTHAVHSLACYNDKWIWKWNCYSVTQSLRNQ